ncbi:MAG TPA: RNA polymerase sigma factor [Labilithrix sp.]|nr:RNA polymerase sigma factor [Labilithrix sp.]
MASQTSSDELGELIVRARDGDRHALETLLATIAPSVHRFGLRMCRNTHDAEDVLQDTLLNVARHLGSFEGRSSLSSWVFALTRSACAKKRRGLKNQPPEGEAHLANMQDLSPSPEARAADHELAKAIATALDGLSDDHREVILLRDVEGLSANEAAGALAISVDALKSRLHRAREALRTVLRPMLEPTFDQRHAGCPNVARIWSKKLEGDLSQADCLAMEKHLLGCPVCASACDTLRQALLACQRFRAEAVPREIQARVKSAVLAWATAQRSCADGDPRS